MLYSRTVWYFATILNSSRMLGSFIDALLENKVVFVEFIPHAYTLSQQTMVWLARNVPKNVITKYALKSSVTKSVSVMHSRAVELYRSILTECMEWFLEMGWCLYYDVTYLWTANAAHCFVLTSKCVELLLETLVTRKQQHRHLDLISLW